jgi:hypothetical protein
MVSKDVINAYARMFKSTKKYVVEGEMEYDFVQETVSSKVKAITLALDLMEHGYNVSINKKYFGGNAMAEHQLPENQGYFGKQELAKPKSRRSAEYRKTSQGRIVKKTETLQVHRKGSIKGTRR